MEYELFKKEFEFTGKHARMASELWVRDDPEHSFFTRLIDLYVTAAVIGFRTGHRAEADYSNVEPKSIFPEQMIKAKEDLEFILQMMLLLENQDEDGDDENIKKAFKSIDTKEERDSVQKYFNDYVRGGVERMYDMLIVRNPEPDEPFDRKAANMVGMLDRMKRKKHK